MPDTKVIGTFTIHWIDREREPQNPPNPAYPNGIDIDTTEPGQPTCKTLLPYPAKRCGLYHVKCDICGMSYVVTTAGRPDDPRSLTMPCKDLDSEIDTIWS
jgi:hypothetical protein